jgi:transcriptional regulator with XRE-family HTH domain
VKARQVASPFPTAAPYAAPVAWTRACSVKAAPRDEPGSQIGAQVRALRIAAGDSGGRLSAACGVSRSMLSRIERGLVSPSIETLARIATGLRVPLSRFFGVEASRAAFSHVREGQGIAVDRAGTPPGCRHELLGHLVPGSLSVEPYKVTVADEGAAYPLLETTGLKFVYVLSGRAAFRYDNRRVELQPGDALLFEGAVTHGFEDVSAGPMVCLSVQFALRGPQRGLG